MTKQNPEENRYHPVAELGIKGREVVDSVIKCLDDHADLFKDQCVLDVGCNEGLFTFKVSDLGARIAIGMDVNRQYITTAYQNMAALEMKGRNYKDVGFEVADLMQTNMLMAKFDVVMLLRVMIHIEGKINMFEKLAKFGKRLFIFSAVYDSAEPLVKYIDVPYGVDTFPSISAMEVAAKQAGLMLVSAEDYEYELNPYPDIKRAALLFEKRPED